MPAFSQLSRAKLATCDPRLQTLLNEVVKHVDCTVLCGRRGKREQEEAFEAGASKAHWPDSKHNAALPNGDEDPHGLSKAVDVAPYPVDWKDRERFALFAGFVKGVAQGLGIKVRLGCDWNGNFEISDERLQDFPHVELAE